MRVVANTSEAAAVDCWRRDRLLAAGFEPAEARRIAADPRWDLHALIELVERGCTVELVVRILEP